MGERRDAQKREGTIMTNAMPQVSSIPREQWPPPSDAALAPIELEEHARLHADRGLIDALIQVVRQGASDLHLTVGAAPMIRVDGALRAAGDPTPWGTDRVTAALLSLLSPAQREKFDR
jgi:twitching motility protein PilT